MKKQRPVLLAFLAFFGLFSCEKFLDLEPKGQSIAAEGSSTDTAALYSTATAAEAALAGCYADFKNEYFQLDRFVNGDAQSDDAYAGADNPSNFQIDDYRLDATNSNVGRDWRYLYQTIGKCNAVVNNIEKTPDPALDAARKAEMIGEARFIRAFMYFEAVRLWGDVPLQLKEVKSFSAAELEALYPQLFPARAPQKEVFDQIVLDLEAAISTVKVSPSHKGFASKGAANALLAKVYATLETPDWAKVNAHCDAVIAGGYQLTPTYDELWQTGNENTSESIFEINYAGGAPDGNWGTKMFRGLDWKKFNIPSNDLVAAFDAENDQVRKNSSIYWGDVSGRWSDAHWPQKPYPFINKWRKFTEGSDQNYIFIRLADILLLKAEALNETGDQAGAVALVNQIRKRVNLPNTTATTQADLRLAIEKERRLELAFEAHRWFDLKRTGRAIDVMSRAIDETGGAFGYFLTPEKLVWPIPQAELDKNSKLVQNAGY